MNKCIDYSAFVTLFGKEVKYRRKKLNLSQEEFAFLVGLHRTYIGMIERGEKNITIKNIYKIALALKIEVKDLFNFSNNG